MELSKLKEPFPEDCVEWRLSQCGETANGIWAQCLAYISARAVMDRLDEVCGPENWKVEYTHPVGGVICKLTIHIGDDKWITKEDGAEASDIEPFKGGISGALKRAANVWGIGRYLYGLETNFANIVENRKVPGAKYGKTKEGKVFYWTPPPLPDWALPKKKDSAGPTEPAGGDPVQHTKEKSQPGSAEIQVGREKVAGVAVSHLHDQSAAAPASSHEPDNVANDDFFDPPSADVPPPTKCRCGGKLLKSKYAPELYCEKYKDKSRGEHTKVQL